MKLTGELVRLIPFEEHNWESIANWYYSGDYQYFFRYMPTAMTREEFRTFPHIMGGNTQVLMIYPVKLDVNTKPIGLISIRMDTKPNRAAHWGILLAGDHQKSGICRDAFIISGHYLFNELGYHKMIIEVSEEHEELRKICEYAKFLYEGKLLSDYWQDGEWKNTIRYCMFDGFFNKRVKGRFK